MKYMESPKLLLQKNTNIKDTIIIAFIMKIFQYIPIDLRDEYINRIKENIKDLDNSYNKLFKYFDKNWINIKLFKFS